MLQLFIKLAYKSTDPLGKLPKSQWANLPLPHTAYALSMHCLYTAYTGNLEVPR